jgi:hypothetical protein
VRERWNVIVQELNRRGAKSAAALLSGAQPLRCDDGVLVIGFQYGTHRDLLERGENKQRLAAALVAVFGQPLRVRSELIGDQTAGDNGRGTGTVAGSSGSADNRAPAADDPPSLAPRPAADNPRPTASDTLEGEALLHEVVSLFDGRIVDQTTND